MKRFLLAIICGSIACAANSQQTCHSYEYVQQLIKNDPALAKRLKEREAAEANPLQREVLSTINTGSGGVSPVIRIPVVVHILYHTTVQNISDAQVRSQIDALNRDFRRLNADSSKTPAGYVNRSADCQFEFVLANVDPKGFVTTGILRKKTSIQYFGLDDRIKQSAIGGDDPWDANNYLNIWVGSLAGALYGYASPVYGPKDKDGVVVTYAAFGTIGTVNAPYDKGRTAVHEVGHWLGLRHIWGDRYCGDDYVDDTPPQQTSSYGCVTGTPVSCGNAPFGNMYMNYMDLTADACTNMFTQGQKNKMRSLFQPGDYREALLASKGADGNGLPLPVEAPVDTARATVGIYPNPVQSTLLIDILANEELVGKTVSVYNQFGQLVMKNRISKQVLRMNVTGLKEGMYFLHIDGDKKTWKIIKAGTAL